jgi:hypothetical protein
MKNSKLVIFLSCLFAATLTAPLVTAAPHGGGSRGGHSFASRPGMVMRGRSGMGAWAASAEAEPIGTEATWADATGTGGTAETGAVVIGMAATGTTGTAETGAVVIGVAATGATEPQLASS